MRLLLAPALLLLISGSAVAKECRMPDLPPGVRVRLPPGCKEPVGPAPPKPDRHDSPGTGAGFTDLGNGTKVRIGGRIEAEMGFRR